MLAIVLSLAIVLLFRVCVDPYVVYKQDPHGPISEYQYPYQVSKYFLSFNLYHNVDYFSTSGIVNR